MQIVYIHGLDSNPNAEKAQKLKEFCAKNFPQIKVVAPDLNCWVGFMATFWQI